MATKPRGGGGGAKGLSGWATKKRTFFCGFLKYHVLHFLWGSPITIEMAESSFENHDQNHEISLE